MRGCFISFEGGEGAGKSTQIARLAEHLKENGYDVILTREPGGTAGAEAVRHVLLSGHVEKYGPAMEAILFAAARADHIDQLIAPALNQGKIVLCDRFIDSTRVYQGQGTNLPFSFISTLEKTAIHGMMPDITFILDIPAEQGMLRADVRRGKKTTVDRFEKDSLAIQEMRRQAFLEIAREEPERCHIIDATCNIELIATHIQSIVDRYLESHKNG